QPRDVLLVVGGVGLELVGRDDGDELSALHRVAFLDEQLRDLAADLRTDDHVVGGDDAGEGERRRPHAAVGVGPGAGGDRKNEQEEQAFAHLGGLKQMYKTFV